MSTPIDPGVEGEPETYPNRLTERFDETELYDWVRRQLGHPIVDVELEREHVEDALGEALAVYSRHKSRKATESFVTAANLPAHIYHFRTLGHRGVLKVEFQGVQEGLTAPNIEAQLLSGSFAYYGVAAPKFDLRYYEYARQWVKIASRELSSEETYRVSEDQKVLYVYTPGKQTRVTVTLALDHVSPTTIPSWDQEWVRKFVLSWSKTILGRIRSKFSTVKGANGDITMDGEKLLSEGQEELKALEERIAKSRRMMAPSWG